MNMRSVLLVFAPVLMVFLLPGCGSSRSSIPPNAPLIDKPIVVREENTSNYSLMVLVCNSKPAKLEASVEVKGAPSEVLDRHCISGLTASTGACVWYTLCDVKQQRRKPIYVKIEWQAGSESGVERFVVNP